MSFDQIMVFGGTGFVGRRIVKHLSEADTRVQVAVRHPKLRQSSTRDAEAENVSEIYADIRDPSSVARATEGSQAVINAVSLYVERADITFDAVHLRGAQNVARQTKRAGIKHLVYLSGLGADPKSRSSYVRARAQRESLVQKAFTKATILRPSVIFGPRDSFFTTLSRISRFTPAVPLFGNGDALLQPVYVGDVAEAAVRALSKPEAQGQVYELGGPQIYSYKTLVKLLLDHLHRKRLLIPMPFILWEIEAILLNVLPTPPLTRDQVILMQHDNVVGQSALSFADLGIEPTAVETELAHCIRD